MAIFSIRPTMLEELLRERLQLAALCDGLDLLDKGTDGCRLVIFHSDQNLVHELSHQPSHQLLTAIAIFFFTTVG